MLAAGGEVWVADETALREFPPLRASWSQRGTPAVVLISGKNPRRTIFGALNGGSGELVTTVRERCRTDDVLAAVDALGRVRPAVPKLLIWDNAPPHHPHRVRDAAATFVTVLVDTDDEQVWSEARHLRQPIVLITSADLVGIRLLH